MKRALHVVDDSGDPPLKPPLLVSVAGRLVSVVDTGDGVASVHFVGALVDAGATRVDSTSGTRRAIGIVIRGRAESFEGRLRAEAVEEAADVVLGSARPGFAGHFASACARWVNS